MNPLVPLTLSSSYVTRWQVVAYGYHGRVREGDAHTPPEGLEVQEEHHLEEHPALLFHKAVVGG